MGKTTLAHLIAHVTRCEFIPVPMHLRNAPTKSMKAWGYGEGYQHAHKFDNAIPDMECQPPSLTGRQYYFRTDRGIEKRIRERLEEIRRLRGAGE